MPRSAPTQDPVGALVDSLGALSKALAPFRNRIAAEKKLKETLRKHVADEPPGQAINLYGNEYVAFLGPRGVERTVNVKKLAAQVSHRAFIDMVTVTLKSAEETLAPALASSVIESRFTGTRPLEVRAR
jgi:hypothetical protein